MREDLFLIKRSVNVLNRNSVELIAWLNRYQIMKSVFVKTIVILRVCLRRGYGRKDVSVIIRNSLLVVLYVVKSKF